MMTLGVIQNQVISLYDILCILWCVIVWCVVLTRHVMLCKWCQIDHFYHIVLLDIL